jgi:hypothetical protein
MAGFPVKMFPSKTERLRKKALPALFKGKMFEID